MSTITSIHDSDYMVGLHIFVGVLVLIIISLVNANAFTYIFTNVFR